VIARKSIDAVLVPAARAASFWRRLYEELHYRIVATHPLKPELLCAEAEKKKANKHGGSASAHPLVKPWMIVVRSP
jgi:hypothetical protein